MEYETRILKIALNKKGERIFSQYATEIEICDEAAGEFVKVTQDENGISIEPSEWPVLREAIDRMVKECTEHGND